jgi:uncharacterized protein YjbJ (UPF0337 family)
VTAPGQAATQAKDQTKEVLGTAADQAGTVKDTATSAASDVAGTAKEQVGSVVGEAVTQAKDLTSQVKDQAAQRLDSTSTALTSSLKGFSGQLSEGDTSGVVGQLMTEAGTRLRGLSDYLERVGPEGLLNDVRGYARRSPGSFLLTAALAGVVSGRLMKGLSAGSSASGSAGTGLPGSSPGGFSADPTQALPTIAQGTAGGDPLAGIATEGIGEDAGYVASPYPDSTYSTTPLYDSTSRGGAL